MLDSDILQVLLVDDDEIERRTFKRFFERDAHGYQLTTAGTVDEARRALEEKRFDAVITDYSLDGETGFDVLDLDCRAPIIFVTGRGDEMTAVRALKSGAYDYLVKDVEDRYVALVPATLENVITRYRAEQALRLVRFERAVTGVARLQPDGKLLEANSTFARMLGYSNSREFQQVYDRADQHPRQQIASLIAAVGARDGLENEPILLTRADGSELHLLASGGRLHDDIETGQGEVLEISAVDVSELREAQHERELLQRQLQQAQKMEALGTLAGGIAHDFNNLLTAILGYTDLALQELESAPSARENMQQVARASRKAQELVRQIVTFGRKSPTERRKLELNGLVSQCVDLLRPSLPYNVELSVEIEEGTKVVSGDSAQLEQVLLNLCHNAMQAMKKDGGRVSVRCRSGRRSTWGTEGGPHAVIEVEDSGIGIDEATVSRIFDPFFTTKPEGEGTGLGLSVVAGIVERHEGAIDVSSQPGMGTTMLVRIPVIAGEAVRERSMQSDVAPTGGSEQLLIVDDEDAVRILLERMLRRLGYSVTSCENAQQALAQYDTKPHDLVVSDMRMPGMNGLELVTELRNRDYSGPVLMLSGTNDDELRASGSDLSIDDFVSKPISMRQLASKVREVLDRSMSTHRNLPA